MLRKPKNATFGSKSCDAEADAFNSLVDTSSYGDLIKKIISSLDEDDQVAITEANDWR